MKIWKIIFTLGFFLAVAIIYIFFFSSTTEEEQIIYGEDLVGSCGPYYQKVLVVQNETRPQLLVEVSDNTCKTMLGLSGRVELTEYMGMWFEFDDLAGRPFWMKDMNLHIDMIWFDDNFTVVEIAENVSPDSYDRKNPLQSQFFGGNVPSQFVLETRAGWVKQNKIKIGTRVNVMDLVG